MSLENALRTGAAIFNSGYYYAAHDAWEPHWLDLERGTETEQLLHGLIQYTAAVYHAQNRNWEGATGLAASAQTYLETLPPVAFEVTLSQIRPFLATLEADPAVLERERPPPLSYAGSCPTLETLSLAETMHAAPIIAEATGYDPTPVEEACRYIDRDRTDNRETSPFIPLVFDFVREEEHRSVVYQRLSAHVSRRHGREADVSGLF